MMRLLIRSLAFNLVVLGLAPILSAQLIRVATWNLSDYAGGRGPAIQTSVYGIFEDRTLAPDVLVCQAIRSDEAAEQLLDLLNTAPGSPGDWIRTAFFDGTDIRQNVCFYRFGAVQLRRERLISEGGTGTRHPRNIQLYVFQPWGYSGEDTKIAIVASHMKSGFTNPDRVRRLDEATRIRTAIDSLNPEWNILYCGYTNLQTSKEASYVELTERPGRGQLFDPCSSNGLWNANPAFRFLHNHNTNLNVNDRFASILFTSNLFDGVGVDYLGDISMQFSIDTWNDPNHSFRTWGNDGSSFGNPLTTVDNTMVGADIAQALRDSSDALPVYLDLFIY